MKNSTGWNSIETWVEMFSKTDATYCSAEAAVANVILNNLKGYRVNSIERAADVANVVTAIQAYTRMCQEVGLKV